MWKCHKCGKPVYFAERKQSLGYDWHPECLRCEECGKRLNPGQHAEHKGVPYCHVPCYGALFGPQLFGHGTRVESHKSFGQANATPKVKGAVPRAATAHLETKLKAYNQYYEGRSGEVRCREVNGRLILEGALRIHWGVQGVIHLKEDDDQRTVVTVRKRNSCRIRTSPDVASDDDDAEDSGSVADDSSPSPTGETTPAATPPIEDAKEAGRSATLPPKLQMKSAEWDELDDLLQVERRRDDADKLYRTMPAQAGVTTAVAGATAGVAADQLDVDKCNDVVENAHSPTAATDSSDWPGLGLNRSMSGPDCLERVRPPPSSPDEMTSSTISADASSTHSDEVVLRRAPRTGSTAIRRRPGRPLSRSTKIKRRCSINGHFYNRETSFFTPPHGSQMSVWVTSLVNTQEVINLLLEKYKVESEAHRFALFVMRDNGEQKRLREDEYPLLVRVLLGPHEDVVRLFLVDGPSTQEVSNEVAQFLNLSLVEMRAILGQYGSQEEREIARIRERFQETKRRIKQRMDELKVRL